MHIALFRLLLCLLLATTSFVYLHGQYATSLIVAQDSSGDYTSIQAAIDDAKSYPEKPITIFIRPGTYREKVIVPLWNNNLTLDGGHPDSTIISWDDAFEEISRGRNSTFHTATLAVMADNCTLRNMTIENTAGSVGQAIALAVMADRTHTEQCRILGYQDALFADGVNTRQYYTDCYIEGTTDFIFGGATAVFDQCEIRSKSNSYITAASTPKGRTYGFVFINCNLTANPGVDSVFLGRPWRSFAKTAFINCHMGGHIRPEGWHDWGVAEKRRTVFYAEYGNSGPGAETSRRIAWSHQLTWEEAEQYLDTGTVLGKLCLPAMKVNE